MSVCFKCKNTANFKINVLKYCNECFLNLFESKIQKNIPKISSNQKVFIYLKDSTISRVVLSFLERIFAGRPIQKVEIYCKNNEIIQECKLFTRCPEIFCDENENYINREASDVYEYCTRNGFDILFYGIPINSTVTQSLALVCEGKASSAIDNINVIHKNISSFNILQDIKYKEISYYIYLKDITRITSRNPTNQLFETIENFLAEIDDKNNLTVFNILNTFQKLKE